MTEPSEILSLLLKKAKEIHARDPLLQRGIEKDWVCVVSPSMVYDLTALAPEWVSHNSEDMKLRQVTGRKTFILNDAPSGSIEYMPESEMRRRYRDELFRTYERDVARFEIPARSQVILCLISQADEVKHALRRLRQRAEIQQMRLERIVQEELGDSGYVRVHVGYSDAAIRFILDHYNEDDGLLHLSRYDDWSVQHFKDMSLRLLSDIYYVALIRVKPAFVLHEGRRRRIEQNADRLYIYENPPLNLRAHFGSEPPPLFQDARRIEIETSEISTTLASSGLKPFFTGKLRVQAKEARIAIERGELQRIKN